MFEVKIFIFFYCITPWCTCCNGNSGEIRTFFLPLFPPRTQARPAYRQAAGRVYLLSVNVWRSLLLPSLLLRERLQPLAADWSAVFAPCLRSVVLTHWLASKDTGIKIVIVRGYEEGRGRHDDKKPFSDKVVLIVLEPTLLLFSREVWIGFFFFLIKTKNYLRSLLDKKVKPWIFIFCFNFKYIFMMIRVVQPMVLLLGLLDWMFCLTVESNLLKNNTLISFPVGPRRLTPASEHLHTQITDPTA